MSDCLVVLIDNYDSFTYNLYQYICRISSNVRVFRNDKVRVEEIAAMEPPYIVISPGPKGPKEAGISKAVIEKLGDRRKILGVCLGHQCINEVFGGRTVRAPRPWHGKTSLVNNDQKTLYAGLPKSFEVARYHSLLVDRARLPAALEVSAWTEDGLIMGIRHKRYSIEGVQFHPESFLTPYGEAMLRNYFHEASDDCKG